MSEPNDPAEYVSARTPGDKVAYCDQPEVIDLLHARVAELEAALDRIGSDRSFNRADCAVYAAEARTGNWDFYSSPAK